MHETEIINKVICLLRQYGYTYLNWDYYIPDESVIGYVPNQIFRVTDYNSETNTLILKLEGPPAIPNCHESTFNNFGEKLKALEIKNIIIKGARSFQTSFTYPKIDAPILPSINYPPKPTTPNTFDNRSIQNQPVQFTEIISFDVRDALFEEGTISFTAKVKKIGKNITVVIVNPSVKKYYDSIKNYIHKILGSNKISSKITFEIIQGQCKPIKIEECILQNLSDDIIDYIQDSWISEYIFNNEKDEIVSIKELADPLEDENLTDSIIFEKIVTETKTKHYHHLRYLSARQAIDLQKLSITGKPFSLVFIIRENNQLFLVWEPYKSDEATYIWKLSNPNEIIPKFGLILALRKNNKLAYKSKKEPDSKIIIHNYTLPLNGFHKWKTEFESFVK